jgi:RNA polymerase sigma-70 factor (ECF subfamily)
MNSSVGKLPFDAAPTEVLMAPRCSFDDLYRQHFSFVWRNLRRLGVPPALVEDAAQDTFIVVHRRLADLHSDASAKAWLFGIAVRVAHDYRRTKKRKPTVNLETEIALSPESSPFDKTATAEAGRVLQRFLGTLDDDKRAVFVLAEMEELSAPEMSEALGVGVNTIYSRLRGARERFVDFLAREGGSDG